MSGANRVPPDEGRYRTDDAGGLLGRGRGDGDDPAGQQPFMLRAMGWPAGQPG